jgi:hypothetical protein
MSVCCLQKTESMRNWNGLNCHDLHVSCHENPSLGTLYRAYNRTGLCSSNALDPYSRDAVTPVVLSEVFCGFPQFPSPQAVADIVHHLLHDCFLPNPFNPSFPYHNTIRHFTVSNCQLRQITLSSNECIHRHKLIFLLLKQGMYLQNITLMNWGCEYVTSGKDVVVACISVVWTSVRLGSTNDGFLSEDERWSRPGVVQLVTASCLLGLHCLQCFVWAPQLTKTDN